jgi:hypothetical protein
MRTAAAAWRAATFGACVALMIAAVPAAARSQTTVPLNTGYNHAIFAAYPLPSGPSTIADNYWINISSFPTTNPAVGPSWVLAAQSAWAAPFPDSRWISALNTAGSAPGVSGSNPGYTIFRKCFCLLPNFKNPTLSFQVRADNQVQVWFNSVLNVALPPSVGNFNGPPLASQPSSPNWFRTGSNCIFVLVEDQGGLTGFDLTGTIQAYGLLPLPAAGTAQNFGCNCPGATGALQAGAADEDARTVAQIRRIAEERRSRGAQGVPSRTEPAAARPR